MKTVRLAISLCAAGVIALALFLFMIGLVANKQDSIEVDQTLTFVDLIEPPPEPEKEEPPPEPEPEPAQEEPQLTPEPVATPLVIDAPALDLPAADLAPGDLEIAAPAATWSSSINSENLNLGDQGSGYVEIIPLGTRKPNIPEIAWKNKIDGWVLVAFTLTPEGRTKNVRILDSYPRGIFEEKTIKAVEDWLYDMRDVRVKGEIILTQRIELKWKDYPNNNLRLDL
ncbi:MAG: TonB family protein [Pseudomonadales bacterium]|nr:TonB family protein [Pseudomonadales bacterium]